MSFIKSIVKVLYIIEHHAEHILFGFITRSFCQSSIIVIIIQKCARFNVVPGRNIMSWLQVCKYGGY